MFKKKVALIDRYGFIEEKTHKEAIQGLSECIHDLYDKIEKLENEAYKMKQGGERNEH